MIKNEPLHLIYKKKAIKNFNLKHQCTKKPSVTE